MRLLLITFLITFGWAAYDEALTKDYWYFNSASYCRESKITAWNCGKPCAADIKPTDVKFFYNSTHNSAGFGAYFPKRN